MPPETNEVANDKWEIMPKITVTASSAEEAEQIVDSLLESSEDIVSFVYEEIPDVDLPDDPAIG